MKTISRFISAIGLSLFAIHCTSSTPTSSGAVGGDGGAICPSGVSNLDLDSGVNGCARIPNMIAPLIEDYFVSPPLPIADGGTIVPGLYIGTHAAQWDQPANVVGYAGSQEIATVRMTATSDPNTFSGDLNQTFIFSCVAEAPYVSNNTITITPTGGFTLVQNCPPDPKGAETYVGTYSSQTVNGVTTLIYYCATQGGAPVNLAFTLTRISD